MTALALRKGHDGTAMQNIYDGNMTIIVSDCYDIDPGDQKSRWFAILCSKVELAASSEEDFVDVGCRMTNCRS